MNITTQKELRAAFWDAHPQASCARTVRGRILPQNSQSATTRALWVDYVDHMQKGGEISEALAQRATL